MYDDPALLRGQGWEAQASWAPYQLPHSGPHMPILPGMQAPLPHQQPPGFYGWGAPAPRPPAFGRPPPRYGCSMCMPQRGSRA